MKKIYLTVVIALIIAFAGGLWFFKSNNGPGFPDMLTTGIVIILGIFGLVTAYSRIKSERRGEPSEDELSKKILQRASSASFYVSLYMWLVVMYVGDKFKVDQESLIGTGILGMAAVFAMSWLFFHFRGLKDE